MLKPFVPLSALDFKVGLRMLARYPGITVIGTIAIAFAITLATVYFEVVDKFKNPRLPIADGDRIVSILTWDVKAFDVEPRILHDFATWRGQLRTMDLVGASVSWVRNLRTHDGRVEPAQGADITANAFRLMGTAPLLGRTLTERDESATEPPVLVIGERLWESRFERDPGVLGRTVAVGTVSATIVGVMPASFGFPVAHRAWMPLRVDGTAIAPRTGPNVSVFGRLAPGRSIADARAEAGVLGARLTASSPATHEHLRPRVTPYQKPLAEGGEVRFVMGLLTIVNTVFLLLLAIMCTNVATLVFARTATRSWEITVRSALGASRGRIVGQLFTEAFVLAGIAVSIGLVLAHAVLRVGLGAFESIGDVPFWYDASLSLRTFAYSGVLALLGAAIVGVLPALRVTRVNISDALRSESAGRAGLKFGGFWTAVIVVQVAINVLFLPLAAGGVFESNRFNERAQGIGAERFMTARVSIDREDHALDSATFAGRARNSLDELERRLASEPGIEAVAFVDRLPVEDQFKYGFQVDTSTGTPSPTLRASTLVHVSRGYFRAFGTRVVAGRDFAPAEFEARGGRVLIVNEAFAHNAFGGRNAVGQRVRIGEGELNLGLDSTAWFEIVGVVKNFGWQLPRPEEQSAMYRPALAGAGRASTIAVRARDPNALAGRLRTIAAEVDPTIRLTGVEPLARAGGGEARINWALTAVAWIIGGLVLMLSASGIHALMSFTVARRTREIGIRAALGAGRGRIVAGVFWRAFLQIGAGIAAGTALAAWIGIGSARAMWLLLAADGIMLAVGLAACALPLVRALRIDPTDALRAEG